MKFIDMGLSDAMLAALEKKWFETASPIQEQCIPLLMSGTKDVIWQAQTWTGKTAAFAIPVIEKIDPTQKHVQAIVIAPTRELASQVANEIESLAGTKRLSVVQVYGGAPISRQLQQLRQGAHIVVGTPGRMIDMINRGKLKLNKIDFCILDEADEMLNMGFVDELESILEACNDERQMLCFSATMPKSIKRVAERYMGEYQLVKAAATQLTTWNTEQLKIYLRQSDKLEALTRIIDSQPEFYGIVFSKTKRWCDELVHELQNHWYRADALHGDLNQKQRELVLKKFKKKWLTILCATDVAARGIDVDDLTHVVNYDLPQDAECYTHRIGRTWRAGKKWIALSFVTKKWQGKMRRIEKTTKADIQEIGVPTIDSVIEQKKGHVIEKIQSVVSANDRPDYTQMIDTLLETGSEQEVIWSLLHIAFGKQLDVTWYRQIKTGWAGEQRDKKDKMKNRMLDAYNTRLFIARGRKDGIEWPRELVHRLQDETNVPQKVMDDVLIKDEFSFITCPNAEAQIILDIFAAKPWRPLVTESKEKAKKGWSRGGKKNGKWDGTHKKKHKKKGKKAYYGKHWK